MSENAPTASEAAAQGGKTFVQHIDEALIPFNAGGKEIGAWLWSLRVPVLLLLALALVPRLLVVWILVVLAKPLASGLFARCPESVQAKIQARIPNAVRHSPSLRDLGEGIDQTLPFILFFLYLCCAPFAVCWMMVHWIRGLSRPQAKPAAMGDGEAARFVFAQNRKSDSAQAEDNFYYSQAFGIVMVAFFALGIPAFFSFAVYEKLGVEQMVEKSPAVGIAMGNSSNLPAVRVPAVGLVPSNEQQPVIVSGQVQQPRPWTGPQPLAPNGIDATFITGYNGYWPWLRNFHLEPTKASIFFVHFYLVSLASALCMLFFRSWLIFPLNFLGDEHDVEFTASGIKRKNIKGWFLSVLTMNRWATGGGPDSLRWNEVKSLRYQEDGFTRLCPLPETAFKKESLTYKLLNKAAALIDGLSSRVSAANFLVFSAAEEGSDFGRNIKLNLNDLNRQQRARLFYSVKNWAPHVAVMKSAEEKLIGSTVLHDVRYTQLWFDLLTSKSRTRRESTLNAAETLKDGEYTVEERISSGGQATTYLARRASGSKCVLKEFVLATSGSAGALVESAREFEAEVSLLSQLHHPGIVSLQDFFSEHGRVYVVMEYVQGQSLRQKVQQMGALSEEEVVQLAGSIADVLEYLHESNPPIVHRDITPENIIVQPDGTIKLIDFSLAVKHDGQRTTDSSGKQAYTPPEQFREEVCVQSDIYALGATLCYLLTASNPKPISRSSPQVKAPHVCAELNSIVQRATELDLNLRYESVRWLKLDLDQIEAKKAEGCEAQAESIKANAEGVEAKAEGIEGQEEGVDVIKLKAEGIERQEEGVEVIKLKQKASRVKKKASRGKKKASR